MRVLCAFIPCSSWRPTLCRPPPLALRGHRWAAAAIPPPLPIPVAAAAAAAAAAPQPSVLCPPPPPLRTPLSTGALSRLPPPPATPPPNARFVPLLGRGREAIFAPPSGGGGGAAAVPNMVTWGADRAAATAGGLAVALGVDAVGVWWYALGVPSAPTPPPSQGTAGVADDRDRAPPLLWPGEVTADVRGVLSSSYELPSLDGEGGGVAPLDMGALLAASVTLLTWHASAAHCGRCGAPTTPVPPAHRSRRCTAAGCRGARRAVYPRLDPSVLVLVTRRATTAAATATATAADAADARDDEECLLGRKAGWAPGRYSVLAGFVEAGEGVADTVVREVAEEAGVAVRRSGVAVVGTQPWAWPGGLLLACRATAEAGATGEVGGMAADLAADAPGGGGAPPVEELEDVRWWPRSWVRDRLDAGGEGGGWHLPGESSIARQLVVGWLAEAP